MKNTVCIIFCYLFVLLTSVAVLAQHNPDHKSPKLVVGIVVDQMRPEFMYRFADKYTEGGFKRLLKQGFEFREAHYDYIPTYTGPGHAAVYTGTTPKYNGIIANNWYDRQLDRSVYVVEDTTVRTVGSSSDAGLMSPKNLLSSTVSDELRLFNNAQSKVIGVALKDRGSILPAGHFPTGAYWYDSQTGHWITSTYYADTLPQWVQDFNARKLPDQYLSKPWETLFPLEQYTVGLPNGGAYRLPYRGASAADNKFPHNLPALKEQNGYGLLSTTPFGNSFTLDFAIAALEAEQLGRGHHTDMLLVSFSSPDYIGHQFGINSIELQDNYVRLDRDLARLFDYLDKQVGMEEVIVFLTSDHGAAQTPAQMRDLGIAAGVFNGRAMKKQLDEHLKKTFGEGRWVLSYMNQQLWFNKVAMAKANISHETMVAVCSAFLKDFEGVQTVYDLHQVDRFSPEDPTIARLARGVSPLRSGDLMMMLQPNWFDAPYAAEGGTTHGSGYSYDTHIPLVWMGWQIKPGTTAQRVAVSDIAATLSDLLRISRPNATLGQPRTDLMVK
ncbi:alkaline phosphatase PafA [Eisenibacter elegans]|uniref:alkaline phosphatase PafA n=1 Tax=Eisenibacter elegans TaxID=997 RepID=UPI0003F4C2AB